MLCLTSKTPDAWVTRALDDLDAVLVDHAHCEIKAANNALSLASRVPDATLALALAALAEEEVRHFRQVLEELARRDLKLGLPPQDRYASELRAIAHRTRPAGRSQVDTLVDRLLVGALIEARSCERFRLLADALAGRGERALAAFYDELFAAEARHYRTLLDMAVTASGGDEGAVRDRLAEMAIEEGRLIEGMGVEASIHG